MTKTSKGVTGAIKRPINAGRFVVKSSFIFKIQQEAGAATHLSHFWGWSSLGGGAIPGALHTLLTAPATAEPGACKLPFPSP